MDLSHSDMTGAPPMRWTRFGALAFFAFSAGILISSLGTANSAPLQSPMTVTAQVAK